MTIRQSLPFSVTENCAALADEIAAVTRAAFEAEYGSGEGEARLIAQLRADGDVAVELAALEAGAVIGHVLFSRLIVDPPNRKIAALAPVCARIDRQRGGVGSALIRQGLARCGAQGYDAVAVLGEPDYYRRFGFMRETAASLRSDYSGEHYQALELRPGALTGGPWRVTYPRAFTGID
jgi:putative acetyltransferase